VGDDDPEYDPEVPGRQRERERERHKGKPAK